MAVVPPWTEALRRIAVTNCDRCGNRCSVESEGRRVTRFGLTLVWSAAYCPHRREDIRMPHYVTLLRYTQQGAAKIKESPARLDAAKKAAEAAKGKDPFLVPDHGKVRRSTGFGVSR